MSDKGKIVIISGPSAAGKGMVVQVVIDKYRYETVVQTTDRKKRDGEAEGSIYNFVSTEEFKDGISKGEYLEYGNYAGAYYGTSKKLSMKKLIQGSMWCWKEILKLRHS